MQYALLLTLAVLMLPHAPRAQEALTADAVMRRADARFQKLQDYECYADTECRLGERTESTGLHIWFRKPSLMRIKVIRGKNKGSEVVMDADGKIRARKGGLLKFVSVGVKANDRRLQNLRGTPLTRLYWENFYAEYRQRTRLPGARTAVRPGAGAHEIVLTYSQNGKNVREIFRVASDTWTLMEGQMWEDNTLVDSVRFRDFRFDSGLNERLFAL